MSVENAKAFLEKLDEDEGLQKKIAEADTPEARLAIANAEGYSFSGDDLQEARGNAELSDAELGKVAGGGGCTVNLDGCKLDFGCIDGW